MNRGQRPKGLVGARRERLVRGISERKKRCVRKGTKAGGRHFICSAQSLMQMDTEEVKWTINVGIVVFCMRQVGGDNYSRLQ